MWFAFFVVCWFTFVRGYESDTCDGSWEEACKWCLLVLLLLVQKYDVSSKFRGHDSFTGIMGIPALSSSHRGTELEQEHRTTRRRKTGSVLWTCPIPPPSPPPPTRERNILLFSRGSCGDREGFICKSNEMPKGNDWLLGLALFSYPLIAKHLYKIANYIQQIYLWKAAKEGNLETCRKALEWGADIDGSTSGFGALHIAAYEGHVPMVNFLLEHGADMDQADSDNNNLSPLHMAAHKGHLRVIQCLVEHGADKDKAMKNGNTPVFIAAYDGYLPIVQYLVEQGADKDKVADSGASPLFIAADMGHLHVVRYLVEQGVDKDKVTINGTTPLYVAALRGHLPVVQYLVDQRVDVDKPTIDDWGMMTPLHIAAREGHLDIAVCLMQHGLANLNARTSNGELPIDVARTEEMRQAILDEEIRRRDTHGFKRTPEQNSHIPATTVSVEEEDDDDDDDSSEASEDENN